MRRRLAAVFAVVTIAAVAIALVPGSAASAATSRPAGTADVVVAAQDGQGVVIEIPDDAPATLDLFRVFAPGTDFSVVLAENPSTGYVWSGSLVAYPEQAVAFVETQFVSPPGPPIPGQGGTRIFRYEAQQRGWATITRVEQRPWESDPIQQVTLQVLVW